MMICELRGKISDHRPANQRMEDVLTSYLFSIFRYFDNTQTSILILKGTKQICEVSDEMFDPKDVHTAKVNFWPRFRLGADPTFREADALLFLENEKRDITAIIIEAKCESGPCNYYENEVDDKLNHTVDEPSTQFTGAQLADEYLGLVEGTWNDPVIDQEIRKAKRKVLLYITSHYELPKSDIEEALTKIQTKNGRSEKSIYWISWRTIHRQVNTLTKGLSSKVDKGYLRYLYDLRDALLRRRLVDFHISNLARINEYTPFLAKTFWERLTIPIPNYVSFFRTKDE